MTIIEAIIQGIIQGLTEFLPVSSSGHLSVFQYLTGRSGEEAAVFSIVLHLGTLIAVVLAFWPTLWGLLLELFSALGELFRGRLDLRPRSPRRKMLYLLLASVLPLFSVVLLKGFFRRVAADNDIVVEGVCFLITALFLFLADHALPGRKKAASMTYKDALIIGCAQAVAPLPGISRSGATLTTGLLLGLDKSYAVSFSFIMGIPAVLGAVLLDVKDVFSQEFSIGWGALAAGLVCAVLFGLLAIGLVRWLVASNRLSLFAAYTFVLGLLVLFVGVYDQFSGHAIQQWVSGALFGAP